MSELITNKTGTFSVPCFGQHVADHTECVKCPLARDCIVVKDAKFKESVRESLEKTQSAPLNASYLVFKDCPDLPQSSTIGTGPGLNCNTTGNSLDLELDTVPGLIPGCYVNPNITVDGFGRVTSINSDPTNLLTNFIYNSSGVLPQTGQVLKYSGACWEPDYETPSGIRSICDADDYDNSMPPIIGQVIAWDGSQYTPTDPELAQSRVSGEIVASGRTEIIYNIQHIFYKDPDNHTCALEKISWVDNPRHLIQITLECLTEPPHSWISETFQNGFCFEMQFPPNNPVFLHWITRNV